MSGSVELICGVDEAGRGPLAGGVFASCVILDPDHRIDGLADSKKLAANRRSELAVRIQGNALAWSVACASVEEIDRLNILWATMLAMKRAVQMLKSTPTEILVDGNQCPELPYPSRAVVGGDLTVPQISAASILAKVARDTYMTELHEQYPRYGFDRHKGYPTKDHIEALKKHGASPVHRRSFAPVRSVVDQDCPARRETAWCQ
ncbi:MAG: ribonuclease HII [Betaproteobacteria bacterium]|nr:MAG: ribonuclease HII [Betaproteobacteria bacterium]